MFPLMLLLASSLPYSAVAMVCGQVAPASHLNPDTRCNFQGSLNDPAQLGKTITLERPRSERAHTTCRNYCLDNQYCLSYSYNINTGACNQYSQKIVDMQVQPGRTGTFLWNRYCWAQNYVTSPGLQNTGFEDTGVNGRQLRPWSRSSSSGDYLPIQSAPGSNGTAHSALLRVGTQIGVYNQSVWQPFSACPNTTYYIQPMYKYLGARNSSRSYLSIALATADAGVNSACAAAAAYAIRPGAAKTRWSPLYGGYRGDEDTTSTYFILRSGARGSGGFSISVSASWQEGQPTSIDDPTPLPDPILDQYLIDFNVVTGPTPENQDPDFNRGISCYIAQGSASAGAGAGAGPSGSEAGAGAGAG